MIEVENLSKRYGKTRAVDHVTFDVRPGRVTGFLGPNGSGKSTTMRMILHLDHPTTGSVRLNGQPYTSHPEPLRVIGALLDAHAVEGARTAQNHLRWLAHSNGINPARVRDMIDLVGLNDVANNRVKTFSMGMHQRLGIAAALLGNPRILMFDEPLNGLDAEGIVWLRNTLKSLASNGCTVFISSHMLTELAQTADHLIVIGRGQILADEPTSKILSDYASGVVVVHSERPGELADHLTRAGARISRTDTGALTVTGLNGTTIGAIAAAAGIALGELTSRSASLEQAFLAITGDATDFRSKPDRPGRPR